MSITYQATSPQGNLELLELLAKGIVQGGSGGFQSENFQGRNNKGDGESCRMILIRAKRPNVGITVNQLKQCK